MSTERHPCAEVMMSTHLGVMGVITDVEYECIEAFDIDLTLESRNLAGLEAEINDKDRPLFLSDDYTNYMYVPTSLRAKNNPGKTPEERRQYDMAAEKNAHTPNVIIHRGNMVKRGKREDVIQIGPSASAQKYLNELSDFLRLGQLINGIHELGVIFNRYFVTRLEVGDYDKHMVGPSYLIRHYLQFYPHLILDSSFLQPMMSFTDVITTQNKVNEILTEFYGKDPLKVVFLRSMLADHIAGISTSSVPKGSDKKYIGAFDFVTDFGIESYYPFRELLADYFVNQKDSRWHPGKWNPEQFDMTRYGDGYVNFIRGLAFDQCRNRAEFDLIDCTPSEVGKWQRLLSKAAESPFITYEIDRLLQLKKFPAATPVVAPVEVKVEVDEKHPTFAQTTALKIRDFIDEVFKWDPNIENTEHGQSFMDAVRAHHDKVQNSVKNNLFFFNRNPVTPPPTNDTHSTSRFSLGRLCGGCTSSKK